VIPRAQQEFVGGDSITLLQYKDLCIGDAEILFFAKNFAIFLPVSYSTLLTLLFAEYHLANKVNNNSQSASSIN
jgi:hypothetical protein